MEWNPITHPYCRECPFYRPVGQFIYELESDPAKRRCRYLEQCNRISKMQAAAQAREAEERQTSTALFTDHKNRKDRDHSG